MTMCTLRATGIYSSILQNYTVGTGTTLGTARTILGCLGPPYRQLGVTGFTLGVNGCDWDHAERNWDNSRGNWHNTGITVGTAVSMLEKTGITLRVTGIILGLTGSGCKQLESC